MSTLNTPVKYLNHMNMTRILQIDDDTELGNMLATYLQGEGFEADFSSAAQDGINKLQQNHYDLLILDIMMPDQSGLETLREVRKKLNTPVLMLTAKGDDVDRIIGLELGADDYVAKPCNPREIVARIRAILRRSQHPSPSSEPITSLGQLQLDTVRRVATLSGNKLNLTSAEFNLLEVLLRYQGEIVNKANLSELGLGRPLARYDRSVDVHISSIRNKLDLTEGANHGLALHTIRGQGYQLSPA